MPHRTSIGGCVHMSEEAWDQIAGHGFTGAHPLLTDLEQECEDVEELGYSLEDEAADFSLSGGNIWQITVKLIELFASVKDRGPIDILYGKDHEEVSEHCFYVWCGGWTSKGLEAPPLPDQIEIEGIKQVDGLLHFVPGEGAVRLGRRSDMDNRPAVDNGRLVRRLGRSGQGIKQGG